MDNAFVIRDNSSSAALNVLVVVPFLLVDVMVLVLGFWNCRCGADSEYGYCAVDGDGDDRFVLPKKMFLPHCYAALCFD